jgi:hypothetical protein
MGENADFIPMPPFMRETAGNIGRATIGKAKLGELTTPLGVCP